MQNNKFKMTPLAIAAFLALASTAQAQTATANDSPAEAGKEQTLNTVVISASADASAAGLPKAYAGGQVARGGRLGLLGNTDVMSAPFNSTNYTQELIQDQQAAGVGDVMQNDPSVRVTRGYGNFQELYYIRGFAVNSDDLGYNGLYGLLPRQFVAAELLERVEVLRGANSFVNGAAPGGSGIGGAINLLPKRASNTPLTQITVGVESGGQAYVAADIGRRFGPDNNIGIRVNAVRRDGDTAVDNEKRKMSVFSVGMDYRGDNFRLSADVGFQDHKLDAPRPSLTLGSGITVPVAADASSNYSQPWSFSNERDTFGTIRGEVDLGKDVVAWAAFGARSGRESNSLSNPTVSSLNGDASVYRFDNERKDTVRTGEVGLRGKLQTGSVSHALSSVVSAYSADSRNAYAISNFAGVATNIYNPVNYAAPVPDFFVGGDVNAPKTTSKTNLQSFAVADTLGFLNDTVLLTVGARHQTLKDQGFDYNTGVQGSSYNESKVTPMAALVFKLTPSVSLYANYVEGLQKGAEASGTGVINVGEKFAPYKSRQKEVGAKYDIGTVGMSAALFTTSQPSAYVQNNIFGVFGEQRNQGLELSVFGAPTRSVRVLGGLTLLNATQRTTLGGINQGNDAIGVPGAQFNAGVEWDVPGVRGLSLNGRTVYTSSQYADSANLQQLPSWTRFDLSARYLTTIADRNVTFRARVDNATDKNYWASAGGSANAGYLVLGAPRTFVLSATVDF